MPMRITALFTMLALIGVTLAPPAVAGVDLDAPVITLSQAQLQHQPGVGFVIEARVEDEAGIRSVALFFRAMGSKAAFQSLPMNREGASQRYTATIGPDQLRAPGIAYYIEARDAAGNTSQAPYPNAPKTFHYAGAPALDLSDQTVQAAIAAPATPAAAETAPELPRLSGESDPGDSEPSPDEEKSGSKWGVILLGVLGVAGLAALAGGGDSSSSSGNSSGEIEITW